MSFVFLFHDKTTLLLLYMYTVGVCAARCMIDYARLSDLESPDCDVDMSSANAPSLPVHDNDKSGSVEEKEDWIDQLVIVCTHNIGTYMCTTNSVCVCVCVCVCV